MTKPSWADVNFIVFMYSAQNIVFWQETTTTKKTNGNKNKLLKLGFIEIM